MLRKIERVVFVIIISLILVAGGTALYAAYVCHAPVRIDNRAVTVTVVPGSSAREISQSLRKGGVNVNDLGFVLYARWRGSSGRLKTGDYLFERGITLAGILEKLEKGECETQRVSIPEGFRAGQIAERLVHLGVIETAQEFVDAVQDPAMAVELGVSAPSLEGFLFPDTYFLSKGLEPRDVVAVMVRRFLEVLPPDYGDKAAQVGLTLHQAVTLASIVEKEAMVDSERPVISGVFHNRIKRGWPLESDPCVRFATGNFAKRITRKNLRFDSPYNTYLRAGLPPGPICNPGRLSLLASVYPQDVEYLFFVSKNNGWHQFSATLEAHNKAVWKYQVLKEVGT